jgi:hypothetical protein
MTAVLVARGHGVPFGVDLEQQLPHPLLVDRVDVGVQKRDDDRGHVLLDERDRQLPDPRLVQRPDDAAAEVDALVDLPATVARNQRQVLARQAVDLRAVATAELEYVPEAARRQQRAAGAALLSISAFVAIVVPCRNWTSRDGSTSLR